MEEIRFNRRNFLGAACGTLVLITVGRRSVAQDATDVLQTMISNNHGHQLVVSLQQLMSNGPKIYSIKGAAGHDHQLELTQTILDTLKQTRVVDVDSSTTFGHQHVVRLQIISG